MTQNDPKDCLASIRWWWRDWRSSTARAFLSPLARGIYRELLDAHFGEKDCALPSDDRSLAALAGVDLETWMSVREDVLRWLPAIEDGRLQNPRMAHEWRQSLDFREGQRYRGQKGADSRWRRHGDAMRSPLANDSHPAPAPSPSPESRNVPPACMPLRSTSDARARARERSEETPDPTPFEPLSEGEIGLLDGQPSLRTADFSATLKPFPARKGLNGFQRVYRILEAVYPGRLVPDNVSRAFHGFVETYGEPAVLGALDRASRTHDREGVASLPRFVGAILAESGKGRIPRDPSPAERMSAELDAAEREGRKPRSIGEVCSEEA